MSDRPPAVDEAEATLARLAGRWADVANLPFPTAPAASADPPPTPIPAASRPTPAPLSSTTLLALLEAIPDSLVVADRSGHIVFVNAQAELLFGYRREELLGEAIEILLPERFRAQHVRQREGFFQKQETRPMGQGLNLVGRRKDGREVPVEISLSPLDGGGDGELVVASVRDVTERRRAETHLRQLETRYRSLIEGIPAVTFMAAMDGEASELYVSPQIEKLLGFTQKEWLANPILWYTQLHQDDQSRWHDEFARTVASAEPFQAVYRFIARDGRTVWVQGDARIVRDDAGRPLFLQGMAFDITAIKTAQEELENLNRTLEQRVAERTSAVEANAMELERSNEALGQFSYVVAHDLRQPLRTMTSYIQKLAERYADKLDAQATDYINRGVRAADRMRGLINDLLSYSRVQTQGRQPQPAACSESFAAACANLHAAIEESGASVTAGELPTVLADATQLDQLFQNLIGNALKFHSERPPEIRVSVSRHNGEWEFAVADNGIGIESQYLTRIFGLGERLHGASKYPGNGIGLATCERIVQRHGGRIWAESPGLGHGATVRFTLPACPE